MTLDMQTALLTTVNAPYQNYLDADGLSAALKKGDVSLGQVASFFTETSVDAQKAFAQEFDISTDALLQAAEEFMNWSGHDVVLLT